jgi:DNA polymerase III subunit alpha
MNWINIHRHSMNSLFDGFGKHEDAAKYAKKIGQNALGLTDHGNVSGLMEHYTACKDVGIKPILGCEVYFQPKFDQNSPRYHLVLLAKNITGYKNLMKIVSQSNIKNFYRMPITDFEILKNYSKGIICSSACAAGIIPRMITENVKREKIYQMIDTFKNLFSDDFYLETIPVKFEPQYKINEEIFKLGDETKTKVIMTFDSHFVEKSDYETYLIMHLMRKTKFDSDYSERFMPTAEEAYNFWNEMHPNIDPTSMMENTLEVADKCNVELNFKNMVPKMIINGENDSKNKLIEIAKKRLITEKKTTKEYKERLMHELKVIFSLNFEDYFLLCYDIVSWAKGQNIKVGPSRGSVGGSLLAYSLGITDLDPIIMGTIFERFLKEGKKKLPDIDIDFESSRRGEVLDYILQKYQGRAAQIATFGYYKVKNLMNDLAKVIDMESVDRNNAKRQLELIADETNENITESVLKTNKMLVGLDKKYPNFIKHFCKLYNQVRFIGKHAAGVAITPDDITNYVALMKTRGDIETSYDLKGLEVVNVLKMDILGLSMLSVIKDAEEMIGGEVKLTDDILDDNDVFEEFCKGNTTGVFQFEKDKVRELLVRVKPKNMQELIACTSLNRPAPIKLGVVDEYVENKNGNSRNVHPWSPYTKDTYGTLIYQEQVMAICRNIGKLSWDDTDKVMKKLFKSADKDIIKNKFIKGAVENGLKKSEARELFEKMTLYLFNKGHGAGYSLISYYCMYLKKYYPLEYFCALIKNENDDIKRDKYIAEAIKNNIVVLLPHVNAGIGTKIVKVDGSKAISLCLTTIKGIGYLTAKEISKHKPYKNEDDFCSKVDHSKVNVGVMKFLKEKGALIFNSKVYFSRVIKYNANLKEKTLSFF